MNSHPRITTRFSADSTALDVVEGVSLGGRRAVVTGATSGLGVETARALAAAGALVTLAVRDTEKGQEIADDIGASSNAPTPRVARLDLADRGSVHAFTGAWTGPLHILVNNAGLVTSGLERTTEGVELQFMTNHLGHFALTTGLREALVGGARETGDARVVVLTSGAHMRSPVVFDDINFERRPYDPQLAYAQSKTADVLFAVELTRRWSADGVFANAVNPGGIRTGLQRHFSAQQRASLDAAEAAGVFTYKTAQQGAATTLVAAVAPEFRRVGGRYLDDGQEAVAVDNETQMADNPHAVKQWALDPESARRLWDVSEQLLGVQA